MDSVGAFKIWHCEAIESDEKCRRWHPHNMPRWQQWCAYHQQRRLEHLEKSLCEHINAEGVWCTNQCDSGKKMCDRC